MEIKSIDDEHQRFGKLTNTTTSETSTQNCSSPSSIPTSKKQRSHDRNSENKSIDETKEMGNRGREEGIYENFGGDNTIVPSRHRFPHAIVWTPIPCITWLLPFVGHMGIALSSGVIRDFAGSYYVSEDDMAFGWPTRYWQLPLEKVIGGAAAFDKAVWEASEEYKKHTHNLFCDNCHSHVALALNTMNYDGSRRWNMITLTAMMLFKGRYVGVCGFLKQWLPFLIVLALLTILLVVFPVVTRP